MTAKELKENNAELVLYRLDAIDTKLKELDKKVDHNFVNKDTYNVEVGSLKDDVKYLKNLVYGAVGTFIALAIAAATAGRFMK
jgi:tetrahydromethanopterin S-methyltransferase subunit B